MRDMTAEMQQAESKDARRSRKKIGVVESDGCNKTIRVRIDRLVKHPKYGKYMRRRGSLQVHDEKNEAHVGDRVEIALCRPISKTKSWRLTRIVRSVEGQGG